LRSSLRGAPFGSSGASRGIWGLAAAACRARQRANNQVSRGMLPVGGANVTSLGPARGSTSTASSKSGLTTERMGSHGLASKDGSGFGVSSANFRGMGFGSLGTS